MITTLLNITNNACQPLAYFYRCIVKANLHNAEFNKKLTNFSKFAQRDIKSHSLYTQVFSTFDPTLSNALIGSTASWKCHIVQKHAFKNNAITSNV